MIESIKFENYKAFREGELPIKPITILLGPNSCGKSSLLNLLLLFRQSMESLPSSNSFKLNGNFVSFGEALNVVRKKDPDNNLEIAFNISPIPAINDSWFRDIYQQVLWLYSKNNQDSPDSPAFRNAVQLFSKHYLSDSKGGSPRKIVVEDYGQFGNSLFEVVNELDVILRRRRRRTKTTATDSKTEKDLSKIVRTVEEKFDTKHMLDSLKDLCEVIRGLPSGLRIDSVQYRFFYNKSSRNFEVGAVSLNAAKNIILSFSCRRENGHRGYDLESDFFNHDVLEKHRTAIGKMISFEGMVPRRHRNSIYSIDVPKNSVVALFSMMLTSGCLAAMSDFGQDAINHVSPLRAFPKRYYLVDQSYNRDVLNTKDGDSLADILKRKSDVREQVNKWLKKFKLAIDVEDVKEIIHSIRVRQNGLELDLTDVGFGISQVLPVIVQGFLARENSITLIEQPEIHLHPKMQADLADLAIDIVNSRPRRLIIETHSEYLLKRLRRRIAEKKIKAEDVAICMVHGSETASGSSRIESVPIADLGSFPWPKDFTETDLEDTVAFARLQVLPEDDASELKRRG